MINYILFFAADPCAAPGQKNAIAVGRIKCWG